MARGGFRRARGACVFRRRHDCFPRLGASVVEGEYSSMRM